MDNSKSTVEWLNSCKSERTKREYTDRFLIWLEYCKTKGLKANGEAQLEDMKTRRQSNDQTVKFFYDNEVPKFFKWLTTEYRSPLKQKPLSESSALSVCTAVRSFFSYHRYGLEIQKDKLPSSEKVAQKFEDHSFDIYQLRTMANHGDLFEKSVLACGVNLWLRAGDFINLNRDMIELHIKREEETAQSENRTVDIVEFELTTEKEKEPCSCHLSKETVEFLTEYFRTYPKKSEKLFELNEDTLNDLLRRLADKAKITVTGRIRWHCLRKFGITLMHGKVTEPVMKYMVGKHISKDLRTYIQNNKETYKAFKLIEPQISLTKSNGNGNTQLAKQLEELQNQTFKQMLLMKLMEKLVSKEKMTKALEDLATELNVKLTPKEIARKDGKLEYDIDGSITQLSEALKKKDLERILAENGNGNNH